MSANVLAGRCAHECKKTWAVEYGGALPGGPFPGTHGSEGDVRRCEHGHLWLWDGRGASLTFDRWRRISRFWEPRLYRRAVAALRPCEHDWITPDDPWRECFLCGEQAEDWRRLRSET